ncbi:MAG: hypothetical protein RIT52_1761 [Pseudomonadota bacterium]|jgi:hypothetical protein
MKRIFLIAALFALPTTTALAAIDTDGLIAGYQSEGYTTIEVTRGTTQTKVEAIRGTEKLEVVYDNETGATLKSELGAPEADDDILPGVTVRDRARDFVGNDDEGEDGVSDDDDGDDDGKGRGRGRGGDDDGDDHDEGDDHGDDGADHDSGDDHGGDDGGDHDGGDDNGGDDD